MDNIKSKISLIGYGWLGEPLAFSLQAEGFDVVGSKTSAEQTKRLRTAGLDTHQLRLPIAQIGASSFNLKNINDEQKQLLDKLFAACQVVVISLPAVREANGLLEYQAAITQLNSIVLEYHIPHIIFTSSTSVYGTQTGIINEFTELQPETPSAIALVQLERLLTESLGSRLTILRLAGLAGGNRHPGRFFKRYQAQFQSNSYAHTDSAQQKHKSNIEGLQPVNLVHQDDVKNAIITIIKHRLAPDIDGKTQPSDSKISAIYNLCAPEHPLKADYYQFAAEQVGFTAPEFTMNDANERIIDGSLITKALPFVYQYPNPYTFVFDQ